MEVKISALYHDSLLNCLVRVVQIDQPMSIIHLFACRDKIDECAMPFSLSLEEFNIRLKNESFVLEINDPYLQIIDEKDLKTKVIKLRDKAYTIVSSLVFREDLDILSYVLRNVLINKAKKEYNVSKPTLYKYLKKYWRNGMNANGLLPEYKNCGAPGKERESETPIEIRKLCQKGYKTFHLDKGYTIRTAYDETIRKFYKKSIHGKKFSWNVFWEHGRKPFLNSKTVKDFIGERDFQNNIRALKGRSLDMVTGPCQLYQIDSTTRDIKIVASYDPERFIGKPTFYVVKDVFTRANVGIYITLDPPSYIAGCNALYNAFSPKELLLKELGLSKKHLGWYSYFVPIEIVADKAEFFGPKSDMIVNNFEIRLGNTAGYMPWMKGDVEKMIDMVQKRTHDIFLGRGQVIKGNPRITKDTNLEATVTLEELYRITWIVANEYNNSHWIDSYPLSADMIREKVKKIPAEIHKWAIKKRLGVEKVISTDKLYFSLIDAKEVSQNRKGMHLNGQDFVPESDEAFTLWDDLLTSSSTEKVQLVYDPRNYKNIFWKYKNQFHKLRLRGVKDAAFENEWEAISAMGTYSEMRKKAQDIEQDVRNENNTEFENFFKEKDATRKRKTKNSKLARRIDRAIQHHHLEGPISSKSKNSRNAPVTQNRNVQSKYDSLIDKLNA